MPPMVPSTLHRSRRPRRPRRRVASSQDRARHHSGLREGGALWSGAATRSGLCNRPQRRRTEKAGREVATELRYPSASISRHRGRRGGQLQHVDRGLRQRPLETPLRAKAIHGHAAPDQGTARREAGRLAARRRRRTADSAESASQPPEATAAGPQEVTESHKWTKQAALLQVMGWLLC